jgi:hypothetical protein
MPLEHLQHMQHVQHPPIYFCNIKMKQLQHTSETFEILKICICNIRVLPGMVSSADRGRRCPARRRLSPGGAGVVVAVHIVAATGECRLGALWWMAAQRRSGGHARRLSRCPARDGVNGRAEAEWAQGGAGRVHARRIAE